MGTGRAFQSLPSSPSSPKPHLRDEQLQKVSLVAQWVVHQAITEGHHAVREVVLSQPCYHPLLLHVGPAGHINNEVAQVLPVSVEVRAGVVSNGCSPPPGASLFPAQSKLI